MIQILILNFKPQICEILAPYLIKILIGKDDKISDALGKSLKSIFTYDFKLISKTQWINVKNSIKLCIDTLEFIRKDSIIRTK